MAKCSPLILLLFKYTIFVLRGRIFHIGTQGSITHAHGVTYCVNGNMNSTYCVSVPNFFFFFFLYSQRIDWMILAIHGLVHDVKLCT